MNDIAVIFDIDGLMVDTEPLSRRAWDRILAAYECALDDDTYKGLIGFRIGETASYLNTKFGINEDVEILIRKKQAVYNQILSEGVPTMPGLFELITAIERRGIMWGVATSSPYSHAEKILTQLGLWERCLIVAGGDEVPEGKPAPDIYLLATQRIGIAPRRCLALEDSAPGCRAALAAGLLTIAVPNGDTEIDKLPPVHYQLPSLNNVTARLDDFLHILQNR